MPAGDFVVRDSREGYFLWMDKQVMAYISQILGNSAVVIYSWLCYYANAKKQNCFPSFATLAEHTNLSRRTVIRLIKKLEQAQIVAIEREFGHVNVYRLLQVDLGSDIHVTGVISDTRGGAPVSPSVVSPEHHEQDRFEQDLFNKAVRKIYSKRKAKHSPYPRPTEDQLKSIAVLCRELSSRIDLIGFLKRYKTKYRNPPPAEVFFMVCKKFKDEQGTVSNPWGWFQKVVRSESASFNASLHVKEHEQIKQEPTRIADILAGIARHGA
jgi:DNA-binding Lrp family transcriptional regulator